jgi:ribosomal protein S6--L-glutamate ligase
MIQRKPKNKFNQIIILSESPDLYTSKRLCDEARKLKISAKCINPYKNTLFYKNKDCGVKHLPTLCFHRTTGIRYDEHDLTLSKYFNYLGYQITNPINHLETFRSKDSQSIFFLNNNIKSIPSISLRGMPDKEVLEEIFSISKNNKYVLKMNRGNQGIGVNLISGTQSLKSILETFHALNDQKFIIQPYIEHKKELRIFVIKNQIMAIIEKTITSEDFRGNSKRSKARFIKTISNEIHEEILRIANLSGLDYCGIDVLISNNQIIVLEINAVPGFKQIEELSKLNIAKELILSFN